MRKYCCILAVLVVFTSCSENKVKVDIYQGQNHPLFTCSLEAEDGSSMEAIPDTKVYVDTQSRLFWNEGDRVSIFTRGLNEEYVFTGKTGDIGGSFAFVGQQSFGTGSPMSANYAVYPYYSSTTADYDGNIRLIIPSVQTYRRNSFGPGANLMVAVTKSPDDYFLPFKNACGYLSIKLFGHNVCVKTITFKGNNDEPLTGKATIKAAYSEQPELTIAADGGKEIVLDCGQGVTIGKNKNDAVTFWVVVPPITFTKGFTFKIEAVNGEVFEKSSSKEQIIKRNICKDMSPVNINSNYNATNVTEVTLDQNEIYFKEAGETIQLHATVYPVDATNKNVFWTSFDESVAIVDEDGVVTAVGEGNVTIEVKTEDGEKTAEAIGHIDWSAPAIDSHSLSATELDVTGGPQTLIITTRIVDATGYAGGQATFCAQGNSNWDTTVDLVRVSGDEKDGIYEASFTIPTDAVPGVWYCYLTGLADTLGNLNSGLLNYSYFTVINNNALDNSAPEVLSHSLSATELDVTGGPQTLIITTRIVDATGYAGGQATFCAQGNSNWDTTVDLVRVSGDEKDGIYEASFTIPTDAVPGVWYCYLTGLVDTIGNLNSGLLNYSYFTVINNNALDNSAPEVLSHSLSATELDVTGGPQTLIITTRIVDATGYSGGQAVFCAQENSKWDTNVDLVRVSGDEKDGIYEASFTIPTDAVPGVWYCYLTGLVDTIGNLNSGILNYSYFTVINNK